MLKSWEGVKFFQGGHRKDVGADCIGFIASVVDELYGQDLISMAPKKSCFSPIMKQKETMDYYIANWPGILLNDALIVDVTPGDIILCENPSGSGHVFMAGPRENTFWHCAPDSGVQMAGIGDVQDVYACFKMLRKESWLKPRY